MVHALVLAGVIATLSSTAHAHSSMAVPKPTFPEGFYTYMNPVMRIDGEKFDSSIPSYQGVKKITAAMKGQASLKAFIMDNAVLTGTGTATKECGWALANGTPQPLPDAVDFPWAHPGPCEVWCDNTKVLFNEDCMGNNVGKVSLTGKCSGAKMIQGMYVGTHVPNWEVYMQCAPIISSGGGGAAAGEGASNGGSGNNSGGGNAAAGGSSNNGGGNAAADDDNSGGNAAAGGNNAGNNSNTNGGGSNGSSNASNGSTNGSSNNKCVKKSRSYDFENLDKRQLRSM